MRSAAHDLGRLHLVAVRVVGASVGVVQPLDPLARRDRALGGDLVGVDRERRRTPCGTSALPKVWSKCSWVLTIPTTSPDTEPAYVVDHLARGQAGGVGVDDQQAAVAADQGAR